jgi:hypothetical protein
MKLEKQERKGRTGKKRERTRKAVGAGKRGETKKIFFVSLYIDSAARISAF